MASITERCKALTVNVQSPDGGIRATARAGRLESAQFVGDAYQRYRPQELEQQITHIARLLYVGHERGTRQIFAEFDMRPRMEIADAVDEAQRTYLTKLYSVVAKGSGPRGEVRMMTKGMLEWKCRITEGALQRLSAEDFLAEAIAAGEDTRRNSNYEVMLLKDECFGSPYPQLREERDRRKREQAGRR